MFIALQYKKKSYFLLENTIFYVIEKLLYQ